MCHFNDEQTDFIRTVYEIPNDISVTLFSLTTDQAWRDTSYVLVFAMEQNEWKKWKAFELSATEEKAYIVFNDTAYYLAQEGKIEPYHLCREYLPIEGTGPALYSIHNFLAFPAAADLRSMIKEFGEKVDGLPRYEVVI